MTLPAGYGPENPWLKNIRLLFLTTMKKCCCIVFKNEMIKKSVARKISKKIVKHNFSKGKIKQIFPMLVISFLSDSLTVITSFNQGELKCEDCPVVSIHWLQLTKFSLCSSQWLATLQLHLFITITLMVSEFSYTTALLRLFHTARKRAIRCVNKTALSLKGSCEPKNFLSEHDLPLLDVP